MQRCLDIWGSHSGKKVLGLYECADIKFLNNTCPEARDEDLRRLRGSYGLDRYNYRGTFMGVRYPDGWPMDLRETHCELCHGFHPRFRFEHVRPLLSFLEDMTLCIQGYGSHLYVDFSILPE
jgi:hypothetical protein